MRQSTPVLHTKKSPCATPGAMALAIVQPAGTATLGLRAIKNPPWGRARKTKSHLPMLWTQLWQLQHDATITHACYVKRNVPKRAGFTHQKSPCNAGGDGLAVVQHAGTATLGLRAIKNPPCRRVASAHNFATLLRKHTFFPYFR
jgi:hypothetical protein